MYSLHGEQLRCDASIATTISGVIPEQYPWISASMGVLKRDFLPEDLFRIAQSSGVESVVSVQARQSIDENQLAARTSERSRLDSRSGRLVTAGFGIDRYDHGIVERSKEIVGLRHVIQDESDTISWRSRL